MEYLQTEAEKDDSAPMSPNDERLKESNESTAGSWWNELHWKLFMSNEKLF